MIKLQKNKMKKICKNDYYKKYIFISFITIKKLNQIKLWHLIKHFRINYKMDQNSK